MDLQTRKLSFIQEFLRLQNEEVISTLEALLQRQKAGLFESDLKPMTMEQLNREIDRSLEDSKAGRVISATDLKAQIQNWV